MRIPLWLARLRYNLVVHVWTYWKRYAVALPLILVASLAFWVLTPPASFPVGKLVVLEDGVPLLTQSQRLRDEGILRSSFVFSMYMRLTNMDDNVKSGTYLFERPLGMLGVAHRLVRGEYGLSEVRVTLTEGMTVREMTEVLDASLPQFDADRFRELARLDEGYLFPDTYFFALDTTAEEVHTKLRSNFDARIVAIQETLDAYPATLEEEVIMASLLEKEARTMDVRRMVAGILWNRIEFGMPLQVDAVFGYIYNRPTYSPSFDDLESDSPYNTYRFEGLPPGPINNPGLEALEAAATPIDSSYLYYLTDEDGNIHYARTFEEHKRNRELYLD